LTGDKIGDQAAGRRGAGEPDMAVTEMRKRSLFHGPMMPPPNDNDMPPHLSLVPLGCTALEKLGR
jgi:hypothetical protein